MSNTYETILSTTENLASVAVNDEQELPLKKEFVLTHSPQRNLSFPQDSNPYLTHSTAYVIPIKPESLKNRSYPFRMPLRSGDLPFKALNRLFPPQRARCPTGTYSSCSLLGSANPHRNVAASQMAFFSTNL